MSDVLEFETEVSADFPIEVQNALIMREVQAAGADLPEPKPTTIRVTRNGEVIREWQNGQRVKP